MLFVSFLSVCSTEMHRAKHFLNISRDPLSLIFHLTSTVTTLDLLKTSSLQTKHSLSFPVAPNTQVNQLHLTRCTVWCHREGVTLKWSSRGRVMRLIRKRLHLGPALGTTWWISQRLKQHLQMSYFVRATVPKTNIFLTLEKKKAQKDQMFNYWVT